MAEQEGNAGNGGTGTENDSNANDTDANASGTGGQVEFTTEQQTHIDKIIGERLGRARTKWDGEQATAKSKTEREAEEQRLVKQAEWKVLAEKHELRISELEPLEGQVKALDTAMLTILETRLETLGAPAKAAVGALPESLGAMEKLQWLTVNEALFVTEPQPDIDANRRGDDTGAEATKAEMEEFAARMNIDVKHLDPKLVAIAMARSE